jgi:hypothetical protein
VLVAAVPQVVASLLCGSGGPVAVNDPEIEELVLMKLARGAGKDPVDAAIGLPSPQRPIDARVVDFRTTLGIRFNRQHLPLTPHVQQLQDLVEDLMQR